MKVVTIEIPDDSELIKDSYFPIRDNGPSVCRVFQRFIK